MSPPTRREALSTLALGAAALATGCAHGGAVSPSAAVDHTQGAITMSTPRALAGDHSLVPLPFDPTRLDGLSERLIVSHHQKNYAGAVKNLNRVEQELSRITGDTPGFLVAALRERELMFRNSKGLHELYFDSLGGDGKSSGGIERALAEAYGSTQAWEQQFRATGGGLGGGSGWVVLALELDTGALRSVGMASHLQSLGTAAPLLVMDMYEHSYHMDFGAAAEQYIDAFFRNIQWDAVNRRHEGAQKAATALRGSAG